MVWLCPEYGPDGLPVAASLKKVYQTVNRLVKKGKILAAYTPGYGGVAEGILKMSLGNGIGLAFDPGCTLDELFSYAYGSFILELTDNKETIGLSLGTTTETGDLTWNGQTLTAQELLASHEGKLEPIYPCNIPQGEGTIPPWFTRATAGRKLPHQGPPAPGAHPRLPRHQLRV